MIGCLRTHVCKQPIIALYSEFETVKFYNLGAWLQTKMKGFLATLDPYDAES